MDQVMQVRIVKSVSGSELNDLPGIFGVVLVGGGSGNFFLGAGSSSGSREHNFVLNVKKFSRNVSKEITGM